MTERLDFQKAAPGAVKALLGVHGYLHTSGLEHALLHLVYLRASQVNGCGYCIDMHWKDARAAGEPEQKLSLVPAWREAPSFFTPREQAALAWTEALTLIAQTHAPDDVYAKVREQFTESEIANLSVAIGAINTWNRIAIGVRKEAGSYQTAKAS